MPRVAPWEVSLPDAVWVLVVEDEVMIQELVRTALEDGGYSTLCVVGGDEALAALDGPQHFSALVTDIRLADATTGWEVAHHARQLHPEMAVVYTSGDSAGEYAAEGVPDSTFLQKPFVADQVTTALSTLLNASKGN
jgi:CheY-like chemotaxis protein